MCERDSSQAQLMGKAQEASVTMKLAPNNRMEVPRTRPVTSLLLGSAREHRTDGHSLLLACWEGTDGPRQSRLGVGHTN